MRRLLLLSMVLLAGATVSSACGGDDEPGAGSGGAGGAGASGGASTGGSGGATSGGSSGATSGGSGNSGGSGGSGGAAGADASVDAGDASADATVDVEPTDGSSNFSACMQYFSTLSNKTSACTKAPLPWSSETIDRWVEHCALGVAASGAVATKSDLATCATKLATQSCEQFLASPLSQCGASPTGSACARFDPTHAGCTPPAGTLTDGKACFGHLECASGYCKGNQAGCGVCAPRAKAGQSCGETTDCQTGLVCWQSKCATPLALGATCTSTSAPCAWGGSCAGGSCSAWLGTGKACGSGLPACDSRLGLTCSAGTCVKLSYVKIGASCAGASAVCYDETVCTSGVCTAYVADGATCAAPGCRSFSSCRNGVCSRDNPAYCQ